MQSEPRAVERVATPVMTIRHRKMTTAHTRQRRKETGIEIEWSFEVVRFGTLRALV